MAAKPPILLPTIHAFRANGQPFAVRAGMALCSKRFTTFLGVDA
jgi:hypothetical protein